MWTFSSISLNKFTTDVSHCNTATATARQRLRHMAYTSPRGGLLQRLHKGITNKLRLDSFLVISQAQAANGVTQVYSSSVHCFVGVENVGGWTFTQAVPDQVLHVESCPHPGQDGQPKVLLDQHQRHQQQQQHQQHGEYHQTWKTTIVLVGVFAILGFSLLS